MVSVICKRSGLVFEAENRRTKVHPSISLYTGHRDTITRHYAVRVIEQGKAEGWTTLKQFEEAIAVALQPKPEAEINYDFEGAWVARIVGLDPQFGYQREFLDAAKQDGRFKYFWFPENGIIETCYKSAKGNDTRYFRLIENGVETKILTKEEVEDLLGDKPATKQVDRTFRTTFKTKASLGQVGQTIKLGEAYFVIVDASTITTYHDEDGVAHTGYYPSGVEVVYETHEVVTEVRWATTEEIAAHG